MRGVVVVLLVTVLCIVLSTPQSSFVVGFVLVSPIRHKNSNKVLVLKSHNSDAEKWTSRSPISPRRLGRTAKKQTLYDILRSKPGDSVEQIKERYMKLVKEFHPDAKKSNNNSSDDDNDLSIINAAWDVLSDPAQRRAYDSQLLADNIAGGVQGFLDVAIPAFTKTATSTIQAAASANEVAQQTAQDMKSAYQQQAAQQKHAATVRKLQRQAASLESQAAQQEALQKQYQTQIQELPKGNDASAVPANAVDLTADTAKRLVRVLFHHKTNPPQSSKESQSIETHLQQLDTAQQQAKQAEKEHEQALRDTQNAVQAAQQAERALTEASVQLAAAQQAVRDATVARTQAQHELKARQGAATKAAQACTTQTRLYASRQVTLRGVLQQQHAAYVQRQGADLSDKVKDCQAQAKKLRAQAQGLQIEVRRLERQE